jgi:hypothetical protein
MKDMNHLYGYISLNRFKVLIAAYSALQSGETFHDISYLCIYSMSF